MKRYLSNSNAEVIKRRFYISRSGPILTEQLFKDLIATMITKKQRFTLVDSLSCTTNSKNWYWIKRVKNSSIETVFYRVSLTKSRFSWEKSIKILNKSLFIAFKWNLDIVFLCLRLWIEKILNLTKKLCVYILIITKFLTAQKREALQFNWKKSICVIF